MTPPPPGTGVRLDDLFEAAIPLGSHRKPRSLKREAVWLVVVDGRSTRAAARLVGADVKTVRGWVRETRTRLRHAGVESAR